MKFAYRVIKNNHSSESHKEKLMDSPKVGVHSGIVSFILVAKNTLGFRECARLVKIANDTNCKIEIASGKKSGTTDSILSMVNLGITADKSLVLTIKGKHNEDAFHEAVKIINGEIEL